MPYRYIAIGPYEDPYRTTARNIKRFSKEDLFIAAASIRKQLPNDACLIPMPSHEGYPTYTLELCRLIAAMSRYPLADCLRRTPAVSLCELKNREYITGEPKGSLMPKKELLGMHLIQMPPAGKRPCVVDDIIVSGTTAAAALDLLGENALEICIAVDQNYPKLYSLELFESTTHE